MIYNAAIVLTAAGVAADNLALAFVGGNGMAMLKLFWTEEPKSKIRTTYWLFIFGLISLIQIMVLTYGYWFGRYTIGMLKGEEKLIAIGLLFSMGIRMLQELKLKNNSSKHISLNIRHFLEIMSGTAVYVFAFGCAMNWLNMNHLVVSLALFSFLMLCLVSGLLLGKYHLKKTFKYLNTIAAFLMISGCILFIIELLKN